MDSRSDHGNVLGRCLRIRTFGVTIHDVAAIDTWLEEIATQWSLNETVAFKARVCIAELAANVLEHGIAKSDDDCIVVTVDRLEDEIQVEFVDSRHAFDPTVSATTKNHAQSNGGGAGLVLLQAYACDLTYTAEANSNRTKFKVRLS
jgi:anti-sigma regulatory factor (Ser/Thr protein kinase)